MLFSHCLVTNSICAPSRAVVLTGKYSHINGQRTNKQQFRRIAADRPQAAAQGPGTKRRSSENGISNPGSTGFDHFEVLKGQGQYYNPMLLTNGREVNHVGYTTDIITDSGTEMARTTGSTESRSF